MARFNEILAGRYNRFLQKLFSMKGGPPAPQLASEVSINLQLFNGEENRWLESWNTFASGSQTAFIAGQITNWQLRNPPGSNVIAVVTKLKIIVSVTDPTPAFTIVSQDTNKAAYSAAVGVRCLDNRPKGGSSTTLGATLGVSSQNNTAATGGVIGALPLIAFTPFDFITLDDEEITLAPGDSLLVTTGAVSSLLYVNVQWRERFLEDSERT